MIAEYIWIDGLGELKSKVRILPNFKQGDPIPEWNFDGSSTNQASVEESEVILKPVRTYPNSFFETPNGGPDAIFVICETYHRDIPHRTNTRYIANQYFKIAPEQQPQFGIEQEYYIIPFSSKLRKQSHYCGVGLCSNIGRAIAEEHMLLCIKAGLKVSGINAEVGPSQWEFQIGPVEGIEAADQVWLARYILLRVAEKNKVSVTFHPKPFDDLPGSGCHINFSTLETRSEGGFSAINGILQNLAKGHVEYTQFCGHDTAKRLTGSCETAHIGNFSWGIGSRNTSIRIPNSTYEAGKGYIEDRRPSSNMDPYVLTSLLKAAATPVHTNTH